MVKWGKIVLLFQAVVLLLIGMVFLTQIFTIEEVEIKQIKFQLDNGNVPWSDKASNDLQDIKSRYSVAAYVSMIIAIIELVIILRLG